MNELIAAMVGRSLDNRFPPVDNTPGDVILSIQNLSTKFEPHLQDVSFDVKEGEIFGLYGLVGAGRTELLETIFGVRTRAAGRVYFNKRLMNFSSAKEAMEHCMETITMRMPEDFISMDLQDANRALGEITGDTSDEEIIDRIFTKFCLGK